MKCDQIDVLAISGELPGIAFLYKKTAEILTCGNMIS